MRTTLKATKTKKVVVKKTPVVTKTIVEELAPVNKGATFNEYGTCIECQGGRVECLHNNLVESLGRISCITCGFIVK